jgi:hypothetical protein
MNRDEATGSLHLAMNHLVSAISGIQTASELPSGPVRLRIGDDRVHVFENRMVVCQPRGMILPTPQQVGSFVTAVVAGEYEDSDDLSDPSQSSGEGDSPIWVPDNSGRIKCPCCKGTGKMSIK